MALQQDPSSDDTLTGYENLKLHGMLYGMPAALREQRIGEVLELVDLTDRKGDIVKHYSGGMRRRLELARGLMRRPKVLFLAERAGAYCMRTACRPRRRRTLAWSKWGSA